MKDLFEFLEKVERNASGLDGEMKEDVLRLCDMLRHIYGVAIRIAAIGHIHLNPQVFLDRKLSEEYFNDE